MWSVFWGDRGGVICACMRACVCMCIFKTKPGILKRKEEGFTLF